MKKTLNLLLLIFLVAVLAFSLIACLNDASSTGTGNSPTSDSASDKTSATLGERMALSSAKNYLKAMSFSKTGLKKQLEYEGFSSTEATYAVNHCGADWKEQAVLTARNYLNTMPFSRQELIEQLEFEGFTAEEAAYGVQKAYQ